MARVPCPVCRYFLFKASRDESPEEMLTPSPLRSVVRSAYFCTHPDRVREFGDGVNPVPIDREVIRYVNEAYVRSKRESKWNRVPRRVFLTLNIQDPVRSIPLLDRDCEDIEEQLKSMVDFELSLIREKAQSLGIDLESASPEELGSLVSVREQVPLGSGYNGSLSVDPYQWIRIQMWDQSCPLGSRRYGRDTFDLGLPFDGKCI